MDKAEVKPLKEGIIKGNIKKVKGVKQADPPISPK